MTQTADARPDPDALLAAASRLGRGHLKIFLGAAPGVGKTYAMLAGARRLSLAGIDVLVGVVETHGRVETEALLEGLAILPRRLADYRGTVLSEFDLDAALARRPALLIVDELAHTNAPDSRHPKRYQDVEELLRAGIDVWTAVNIQHLEGLSDVVGRITGVTVRETVPDTVVDKADDVVVVDVTPDELIARLNEGRIYLPENARRAAGGFFRAGNLTALRELALRRTADRVDDQMVDHLRQNAIEGAWPTADRLMVCVGSDASSEAVVRAAGRLASGLNAPWVAVTLERTGEEVTDAAVLRRVDDTLHLAERLGADTDRLSGRDLPDEILRFARRENITQIVIGRSRAGFLARLRGRSLSGALLRRASDIAVHVVVGEAGSKPAPPTPRHRPEWSRVAVGAGAATGSVAAAVAVGLAVQQVLPLPDVSLLFLLAVLGCATLLGQRPAVGAAFLSFLAYNFFFIPPVFTFSVAEPHQLLALLVFLAAAVITGGLAGRVRDQSDAARSRIATVQALYDVSRKLSGTVSMDDVLWVVVRQLAAAINGSVLVLLGDDDGDLAIRAAFPPEDTMAPGEWAAARWAFEKGEAAGWQTGTLPRAAYQFQPVRTPAGVVGVVGFAPPHRDQPLSAEAQRTFAALVDQGALAMERARLVVEARRNETTAERERLQTTLLSSISHDLRTPLASILGAVTSLQGFGDRMSQADRDDLLAAIEEETRRLARFIANLLDMTRVEAGAAGLDRGWIDVADAVANAVARARKAFPGRAVEVRTAPDLPPVRGETVLFEQVLFNLLDNADKYGGADTPTTVRAEGAADEVLVTVEDCGPGIPAAHLERVFEKFTRLDPAGDGRPAGTGLGLAVARGVVEAMGGTIRAESPAGTGRGARLLIRLPAAGPRAAPGQDSEEDDRAGAAQHPGGG